MELALAVVAGLVIGTWLGVAVMGALCARGHDEIRFKSYNAGYRQGRASAQWMRDTPYPQRTGEFK